MAIAARPGYRRYFDVNGWLFVGPAVALIGVFMAYPIAKSLWLSFHSGQGAVMKFAGLGNIDRLLNDPIFFTALTNTFIFLFVQVPIMIVLALIMASCLNMPNLKFRGFLRTAVFLPCVTSLVAYSVLFKSMFSYDGLINSILLKTGLVSESVPWLSDPFWAKVVVIAAITWRWTGYNMVFYLAGLQNIDYSIYEAARIDGASPIQQFIHLTIPLLKPTILLTAIMSTSGTLQLFDESVNLTAGGPGKATMTLTHYIYNISFVETPKFNYAAALSVFILVVVAVLSAIQMKVGDKRD